MCKTSPFLLSRKLLAISYQLSAVSYQLSALFVLPFTSKTLKEGREHLFDFADVRREAIVS